MIGDVENWIKRNVRKGSALRKGLSFVNERAGLAHHMLASVDDRLIRAKPRELYVSMTADCNLRCAACCYGRDFMPGHQLPWNIGKQMLDDAKVLGFKTVRLYGGEPLLHRDIVKYVERISALGMNMWVTTNGLLLRKKIDRLYQADLRRVSMGFYGVEEAYDSYVQRSGAFSAVESSIANARSTYGPEKLQMYLDFLLMRPTSNPAAIEAAVSFALRYEMQIHINLIHYSLPYFLQEGSEAKLSFDENDRALLERAAEQIIAAKRHHPGLIQNSELSLRSIPDWLILKSAMRVPCTEYEMVWVGPDGSVQMCYVDFPMGNLNDSRLTDMVGSADHRRYVRDAFNLRCPNCHCGYDKRIRRSLASRRKYA